MNKLEKMTLREQLLVLLTVLVLVGGAYALLRYVPTDKAIVALQKNTAETDKAVRTGKIPEEPQEDADELRLDLEELKDELEEARNMAQGATQRLASADDATAVRLALSEAARAALVRVDVNEELQVKADTGGSSQGSASARSGDLKGAADRLARKRAQREARERALAERAARRGMTTGMGRVGSVSVNAGQVTPLVRKMAVGASLQRPLQRLTMEGTYAGMTRFMQRLDELGYMATVVQLQLSAAAKTPPLGYNQRVTAVMVIAL